MTPQKSDCSATLEHALREGLSTLARAAGELGAHSVAVTVLERNGAIRVVYQWPDSAAPKCLTPSSDVVVFLAALKVPTVAGNEVARFLSAAFGAPADSFLLAPWPDYRFQVIIAFGYVSGPAPARIPEETSPMVYLAALATWNASEVRRLRHELSIVNERLGGRKTVERAKGILQARHGWSEQEAYEHLRKLSRQRRKTLTDMAQELLRSSPET